MTDESRQRCKARSKTTGEQCKRLAVPGKAVCYWHGGRTPSGAASPHFKTGRYSKDLPTRLAARYEEALADPDLLSLAHDAAVLDARLRELFAGLDQGGATALWADLAGAVARLESAQAARDARAMGAALTDVAALVRRGATEAQRWADVYEAERLRLALVDGERRRLADMDAMISAKQVIVLAAAMADVFRQAVEAHVDDDGLRRRVLDASTTGLGALVGAGGASAPGGARVG